MRARSEVLRRVVAVAVLCLLSSGCGGLLGGAVEAEKLQDGQERLEQVRQDAGDLEQLQDERRAQLDGVGG